MDQSATGDSDLRVLFVSGVAGGTRRCRVFQPMEQLALNGVASTFRPAGDPAIYGDVLDHDFFIFHRVPYTPFVGEVIDLIHRRGKIAIYESDDLVFRPDMIEHDSYYRHLPPAQRRVHEEHVRNQRRTLELCDCALTTTEFLADLLGQEKPVLINRNALGVDWIRWAATAEAAVPKRGHQVVLGYVSGSKSHDYDFAEAADALAAVMARHPDVVLRVVGHLEVTPRLAPFAGRIEEVPFIPWEKVPWELAGIDVNLAPLEQANPYCNSKSELKYIEASILGVPTIASRTQCFEYAIRSGDNGLLAGDLAEWEAALELVVTDPDRRRALGEAARADMGAHYLPADRGRSFIAQLRDLQARYQPPAPPLSDDQVARAIIASMTEQLAEDDRWVVHDPDVKDLGAVRRRDLELRNRRRLEAAVRQARRSPLSRMADQARFFVKRVTGRRYLANYDGATVEVLAPLSAGVVYRQPFVAEADGLCAVDLLIGTFQRVNTCELTVELREAGQPDPVATSVAAAHVVPDTQPFTFPFPALANSAGRRYILAVWSSDAQPGDTVALWRTAAGAPAAGDGLTRDGRPVGGRLVFKARYCAESQ
jgi:glycosyltransferase involved in cell wall biosynthesis